VISQLQENQVPEAQVRSMLREIARQGVASMIARQESDIPQNDSDAYLEQVVSETERIHAAQRARDWTFATNFAGEIAFQNGMKAEDLATPAVARQVLFLMRQLNVLNARVERNFEDPLLVGRDLLLDHGLAPTREAMNPSMLLSAAIEQACAEAPGEVESKIRVVGKLALLHFGDVPLTSMALEQSFEFLRMLWMLPKGWGKSHGRNRYNQSGRELSPLDEIRAADLKDGKLVEELLSCDEVSLPDKRRRLVTELTPRLTDGYLFVQRDMFNRIAKAALGAKRVGRDLDDNDRVIPSHSQLKSRMTKWHKEQKTSCGLPTRVSRPKRRRSWSLEHICRLLSSPIYLGSSSAKQRGRKASSTKRIIIRDAIYWVPLIMISMGVRPEEILQASVQDIVRRDNILCLFLGDEEDMILKNEQSRRILPIPQLLLDLGFREWIVAKKQSGETWLFPEIQPDKSHGRRSQIFGDRFRNFLKTLDLISPREDIYAMRRTLSSKLMGLGIETGTRQKVLGHLEGTTVDRYYSDHGLLELKDILDSVDYGIEVGRDRRVGFPVITGSSTPFLVPLDVEIALTDQREVSAVQLRDGETDEIMFEAFVAGQKAPTGSAWNDCSAVDAKDIAARILALSKQHSLTMPASEEATAALEHLLILVDDKPQDTPNVSRPTSPLAGKDSGPRFPTECVLPNEAELTAEFSPGDLVVCTFPSSRAGLDKPSSRPGLVVHIRSLGDQQYLDVAWGAPVTTSPPAAHELALAQACDLDLAQIEIPTRFNMRKRILIAESDVNHLHKRLGRLSEKSNKWLQECLLYAGDVSPEPVSERARKSIPLTVERRRTKKMKLR